MYTHMHCNFICGLSDVIIKNELLQPTTGLRNELIICDVFTNCSSSTLSDVSELYKFEYDNTANALR